MFGSVSNVEEVYHHCAISAVLSLWRKMRSECRRQISTLYMFSCVLCVVCVIPMCVHVCLVMCSAPLSLALTTNYPTSPESVKFIDALLCYFTQLEGI